VKKYKRFCILLGLIFLLASCTLQSSVDYETVVFVRVVDGDTIVVDRGHGNEYVRLIGIDAPESVHDDPSRNSEEGRLASAFLKNMLQDISKLYIVQDQSNTDKYDRLLRYVWLSKPNTKDEASVRESMVNAIILLKGYAVNVTIQPDVEYALKFVEYVGEARKKKAGLWK
jgi:micrococcal nuclease